MIIPQKVDIVDRDQVNSGCLKENRLLTALNLSVKDYQDYTSPGIDAMNILANEAEIVEEYILITALLSSYVATKELAELFGEPIASLVNELTQDGNLSELQLTSAPYLSREATLVKMADILSKCRNIVAVKPFGWGLKRIQGYFAWSYMLIELMPFKNFNSRLRSITNSFFDGLFEYDKVYYPIVGYISIPKNAVDEYLKLVE